MWRKDLRDIKTISIWFVVFVSLKLSLSHTKLYYHSIYFSLGQYYPTLYIENKWCTNYICRGNTWTHLCKGPMCYKILLSDVRPKNMIKCVIVEQDLQCNTKPYEVYQHIISYSNSVFMHSRMFDFTYISMLSLSSWVGQELTVLPKNVMP